MTDRVLAKSCISISAACALMACGGDQLVVRANGLSVFPAPYAIEMAPYGGNDAVTIANASANVATSAYPNFANVGVSCL